MTASCLICVEDQVTIKTETDSQKLKLTSQSQKANQVMTSDESYDKYSILILSCMVVIIFMNLKKCNKDS